MLPSNPPPPTHPPNKRRVIKDSRTISESHYHVFKRYFGFLCYNALFVFIVTTSIMETVRAPLPGVWRGSSLSVRPSIYPSMRACMARDGDGGGLYTCMAAGRAGEAEPPVDPDQSPPNTAPPHHPTTLTGEARI